MDSSRIFIVGANGQLGTALRAQYPNATYADRDHLDIADQASIDQFDWSNIDVLINAAAYTKVDEAETEAGRVTAWATNASAVRYLAMAASKHNAILVHISTEYVFDGTKSPHTEDEPLSPLSTYGASKAAGDIATALAPKHYIVRTSWVIGEGKNFVRTMLELGKKGINPSVVSDQIGRLTFTSELCRAIDHLLKSQAHFGTYNVSNAGDPVSWADVTRAIFAAAKLPNTVTDTTTADYFQNKPEAAKRPLQSTLSLDKLQATGFTSRDWREDLQVYIAKEAAQ